MTYTHGVYVYENPTPILAPVVANSAIQFIVGTAPINLLSDPAAAVNVPILINSFAEAQQRVGYSEDFKAFTICQSIDASFRVFNVAPLIVVNVLDPTRHKEAVVNQIEDVIAKEVLIDEEGIMLDEAFVVKSADGATTYDLGDDYTVEFTAAGHVLLKIVVGGVINPIPEQLSFSFTKLDPTAVTIQDIIGGYDAATGKYTGLHTIEQVYPRLGLTVGQIVLPGWSHIPDIGIAMTAKTENLNGSFKCMAIKDIDTAAVKVYADAYAWKNDNGYNGSRDIPLWPKVKVGAKEYYYSAVYAALIAYTDALNEGIPFVSPSNRQLRITGTVLESGEEVYLDQVQGNLLNGQGIVTAININGWKSWGNSTGIYPRVSDPKERWIPVRRMFDWWGNSFVLTYFQKVDDPMNTRLIETIVDTENIRANGYKARQQIADARIEFNIQENPVTDLLNGTIRFKQYLTPFTPAETIINVLEFDPNALVEALS